MFLNFDLTLRCEKAYILARGFKRETNLKTIVHLLDDQDSLKIIKIVFRY